MTKFLILTDWGSREHHKIAIRADTITHFYEAGNVPPATRIFYERDASAPGEHIDVTERFEEIVAQLGS